MTLSDELRRDCAIISGLSNCGECVLCMAADRLELIPDPSDLELMDAHLTRASDCIAARMRGEGGEFLYVEAKENTRIVLDFIRDLATRFHIP